VALSTSTLKSSETLRVTGNGYLPGSTVTIELHSTPINLGTATAQNDGTFTFSTNLPQGVIGEHHIVVLGTNATNQPVTTAAPITISTPAATVTDLAFTGYPISSILLWSFALVALGLVLLKRSRSNNNR
jgi:hypothetical protein